MWIEVGGQLVNLDHVIKIEKVYDEGKINFHTDHNIISFKLEKTAEIDQVYFNLLAMIQSKPVDGFLHE